MKGKVCTCLEELIGLVVTCDGIEARLRTGLAQEGVVEARDGGGNAG